MRTPLLTVAQVATYLGCSEKKVWELLKGGRLRGSRLDVGSRSPWRISERDLDDYVALQRGAAHKGTVDECVQRVFDADKELGEAEETF